VTGTKDLDSIRRIAIRAMAAASVAGDRLVLKGGNALSLVYGIGGRASLDLDYSLEDDFRDLRLAERLLVESLYSGFHAAGIRAFDIRFLRRPQIPQEVWWGGYELLFKLIPVEKEDADLEAMRRTASVVGPSQERVFRIQISKHEFVGDTLARDVDGVRVDVYSPALIAAEKLRAICQQMPDYPFVRHPRARARDFYDVHAICQEASVDLASPENAILVRRVFEQKRVPLELLSRIASTRDFHAVDWPSVESSVARLRERFDDCFDFVMEVARRLEAAWHP
jgi:predicted nucleotidyltransferase component of viral defense system